MGDDDIPQTQYFPTQELNDILQEASFNESLRAADGKNDERTKILRELTTCGPFRKPDVKDIIQQHIPFRYRYECHRLAQKASLTPRQFYKEVVQICKTEYPDYEALWAAAKVICSRPDLPKLGASEKSSASAWDVAQGEFKTTSNEKSVILSAALEWADANQPGIFVCKLNPLRLEKSCRFERRFGADRLMYLTLPFVTSDIPKDSRNLSVKVDDVHAVVSRWLGSTTHFIAGRCWRAFFIEEVKKKSNDDKPKCFKICMFATDGADFLPSNAHLEPLGGRSSESRVPVTIERFIDWYMPLASNLDAKDKKHFQRLALGLSRTFPTVVLEQKEFVYLPKNPDWLGRVMNDGCARMSRRLANKISEALRLKPTPSVFQGRISGAKGLWMVEDDPSLYPDAGKTRGFWLEVTDEQLKIKPHPMQRVADQELRTFEVLKSTGTPKVASMNIQLIGILSHGGLPREILEKCLRGNTRGYFHDLADAMKDPRDLRLWVHQHEKTARNKEIAMLGGFPRDHSEQVNLLLEAGFTPQDNEIIVKRLRSYLTNYLETYVERLQIKIDMSTSVWCVPDPYGVLEAGQVHMNFTQPWKGPNGQPITSLHGLECIVYRSPGYLPSDAQRVQGIYRIELSHLLDVIVFSTKGRVPLAHMLSGGDYDGDTCWVCFDQDIVKSFVKDNPPPRPIAAESLSLKNKSRLLTTHFSSGIATAQETDNFLTECFSFNLVPPMLGFCSTEHETLAYHRPNGLADQDVMRLAALVGYLVDSPKQGYSLSGKAWQKLKSKLCGSISLMRPSYKKGSDTKQRPDASIVDYLKLVVAMDEKEQILRDFSTAWPEQSYYDGSLALIFRDTEKTYVKTEDEAGLRILRKLKSDVDTLTNTWKAQLQTCKGEHFDNAIAAMHGNIQLITPSPERDHVIYKAFLEERHMQFSSWSRIRASCLYYRSSRGAVPWYAVGEDLARIKADGTVGTRMMVSSMHNIMKPDGKLVSRLAERAIDEAHDEDEMFMSNLADEEF